ncbi:30S ribosomal protein S3 [Candidatus Falkowbacteria bacterium CG10_big_fil_rev_8_21_14_0_10_44_15]|uniref:Small ribosomal subunit protein uS3 n=1 Tax=Candidatus Falkowbacteria bacterium CG10_big_fil_rev_8_21_14_0_10_44_15 TaxID=1974569 RepID=A0A2H0V0J6_9BACT|nr:MAG: 30S ribosomal protein S3 [Candidatus Falkowbacteria bacterium CG10_big_fil_rev_8_21_14_0_10_44_15]
MGQKVHPKIFRTGVIYSWPSKWFSAGRNFPSKLKQDVEIRRFLIHKLREASVDKVEIERDAQKITVTVYTAKPGLIIGRGGAGAEDLKKEIKRKFLPKVKLGEIHLNINEVDRPNLSASIVMQAMVLDIEKRLPYKRVMKQAIMHVQRAGALGVKALVKGRLNGAEIAREEKMVAGKIPLHTLRADIDYAQGTAHTTYGSIGVKVWIYRGEIFSKEESRTGDVIGEIRSKK